MAEVYWELISHEWISTKQKSCWSNSFLVQISQDFFFVCINLLCVKRERLMHIKYVTKEHVYKYIKLKICLDETSQRIKMLIQRLQTQESWIYNSKAQDQSQSLLLKWINSSGRNRTNDVKRLFTDKE